MTPQQQQIASSLIDLAYDKPTDYVADLMAVSFAYYMARIRYGHFELSDETLEAILLESTT